MTAFLGTVMGWAPNFAPRDWAYCNGALLAISTFTAIFSLVGTIYGGDGRSTFGLPDLRGRALIGQGVAPGMQPYRIGYRGGLEFVTLNIPEMPAHNHTAALTGASITLSCNSGVGTENSPVGNVPAAGNTISMNDVTTYATTANATMGGSSAVTGTVAIGVTGNSNSHENRTPYQVLNWIFCTQGIFPSRN